MRIALLVLALAPTALAAEPGTFYPSIAQGPVTVSVSGGPTLLCVEQATGTIYAWIAPWEANFQLTLVGGCGAPATLFHGEGNSWEGWTLDEFAPTHPTTGTLDGFDLDPDNVDIDLTQTLASGVTLRVAGTVEVIY